MPLINCEVNLILTWSSTCVITNSTDAVRFAITDTKLLFYNYGHYIMRTFDVLPNFPLTTSETKPDY